MGIGHNAVPAVESPHRLVPDDEPSLDVLRAPPPCTKGISSWSKSRFRRSHQEYHVNSCLGVLASPRLCVGDPCLQFDRVHTLRRSLQGRQRPSIGHAVPDNEILWAAETHSQANSRPRMTGLHRTGSVTLSIDQQSVGFELSGVALGTVYFRFVLGTPGDKRLHLGVDGSSSGPTPWKDFACEESTVKQGLSSVWTNTGKEAAELNTLQLNVAQATELRRTSPPAHGTQCRAKGKADGCGPVGDVSHPNFFSRKKKKHRTQHSRGRSKAPKSRKLTARQRVHWDPRCRPS